MYKRTGTLWEGRFKCSLIDGELYFLTCLQYIEMHPVRAGIVNSPELYPCSSYRFRAFGEKSSVLDLDPWYNSSSSDIEGRQLSYRRFFQNSIPHPAYQLIREMTNKDGIAGRSSFKEQIQKIVGREIIFRSPGRPKRQEK